MSALLSNISSEGEAATASTRMFTTRAASQTKTTVYP
jgi:hypothetical protein